MDERRKFSRYSEHVHLKMAAYDRQVLSPVITNFTARTIDMSHGGFRMETRQYLPTGSIIGFRNSVDMEPHAITGIGEVRWQRPSRKSGYSVYGIAAFYNRFFYSPP